MIEKTLQQGIENDHFRVKAMNDCFQPFNTARNTLKGYGAMLWIKKRLEFKGK